MTRLEVVRSGPLTLLQDEGRPGLAALGVTGSGAADRGAYRLGAFLVGNRGEAALECVLGGLAVRVLSGTATFAVTGAPCPVSVDGRAVPPAQAFTAGAGELVALGIARHGLRCYLSVAGGFAAEPVLGSRSRDTLAGIGPEPLRPGDVLEVGRASEPQPTMAEPDEASPSSPAGDPSVGASTVVLTLLPGPRTDLLADPAALAREWQVSPESDRVGVRLLPAAGSSPLLRAPGFEGVELPSEAVVRGGVQLPAGGLPVVFGADHPTTGGYPVVAVLTAAAADRLAQVRPGESVHLVWA
jgi:biotin-dependent carboxylase-like uncharacterized protein